MRINIPLNPDDLIALDKAIQAKHEEDGATSPLKGLDMAAYKIKGDSADAHNTDSKTFASKSEKATQDRDVDLGQKGMLRENTVRFNAVAVRDTLLGKYKGHEQSLTAWGFSVDAAAQGGTTPTPTP
jgi:hypothetical protein